MEQPKHSPLGASSAERWMNCPGSTSLLNSLALPHSDEPDYQREGTAAHEALAQVLADPEKETWELGGLVFNGVEADSDFIAAVDVAVSHCRSLIKPGAKVYIEHSLSAPIVHAAMYGTLDFGVVTDTEADVVDYKHGAGIPHDPEEHAQTMYYAYMLLLKHAHVRTVRLHIVQPRCPQVEPVQTWETTAEHICDWATRELYPAMKRAEKDKTLDAGKWCRFCPAKLVCPLMASLFEAAAMHNPKEIVNLSDAVLGRSFVLGKAVRSYLKALDAEVQRRAMAGNTLDGVKLVKAKANRVYRDGAESVFKAHFGTAAYNPPTLKSPAQMEGAGPGAKDLVKQWAYTPDAGYMVTTEDDRRHPVKVKKVSEMFAGSLNLEVE